MVSCFKAHVFTVSKKILLVLKKKTDHYQGSQKDRPLSGFSKRQTIIRVLKMTDHYQGSQKDRPLSGFSKRIDVGGSISILERKYCAEVVRGDEKPEKIRHLRDD